jgi:hypothetical protein
MGIPMTSLPRTFQDTVIVAQNLGIAYLWIDSLCIVLDDDERLTSEAGQILDYCHSR